MGGLKRWSNRWHRAAGMALRGWGDQARRWPLRSQLSIAAAVFLLSSWLTVTSVSYIGNRSLLSESFEQMRQLEQAYADLKAESELSAATFISQLEALEAKVKQDQTVIVELSEIKSTLNRQLESRERQLANLTDQRDRARILVGDLRQAITGAEDMLRGVAEERSFLQRRLEVAQQKLAAATQQRHAGREVEVGLRWQLARLEHEVEQLQMHGENARLWLKDWVLGSVEALEDLVTETGIDVEQLVARAAGGPVAGQGGPLQAAASFDDDVRAPPPRDPIGDEIQRLAALQRLARTLPLASPLDQFHLTSRFGKRHDPFTNQWAFHAGLDLGAPRGSEVLATAPGRVLSAGPAGPYGNMVAIDHGVGIVTRYAHLKSTTVKAGDAVGFRQVVGVIGTTGRSTSRHLHYEIQIDEVAYDPIKFLDAGRLLVGVLDVNQPLAEANAEGG